MPKDEHNDNLPKMQPCYAVTEALYTAENGESICLANGTTTRDIAAIRQFMVGRESYDTVDSMGKPWSYSPPFEVPVGWTPTDERQSGTACSLTVIRNNNGTLSKHYALNKDGEMVRIDKAGAMSDGTYSVEHFNTLDELNYLLNGLTNEQGVVLGVPKVDVCGAAAAGAGRLVSRDVAEWLNPVGRVGVVTRTLDCMGWREGAGAAPLDGDGWPGGVTTHAQAQALIRSTIPELGDVQLLTRSSSSSLLPGKGYKSHTWLQIPDMTLAKVFTKAVAARMATVGVTIDTGVASPEHWIFAQPGIYGRGVTYEAEKPLLSGTEAMLSAEAVAAIIASAPVEPERLAVASVRVTDRTYTDSERNRYAEILRIKMRDVGAFAAMPEGDRHNAMNRLVVKCAPYVREGFLDEGALRDAVAIASGPAPDGNGYLADIGTAKWMQEFNKSLNDGMDMGELQALRPVPDAEAVFGTKGAPIPNQAAALAVEPDVGVVLDGLMNGTTPLDEVVKTLAGISNTKWLNLADAFALLYRIQRRELIKLVTSERSKIVISPNDGEDFLYKHTPRKSAELFKALHYPNMIYVQDEFLRWDGSSYVLVEEKVISSQIAAYLDSKMTKHFNRSTGEKEIVPFCPLTQDVNQVFVALTHQCTCDSEEVKAPCWLDKTPAKPTDIIAFQNGWLDTLSNNFYPPTPMLFTRNALSFNYDPNAQEPVRFHQFLKEIWPTAKEQEEFIPAFQRAIGYLLVTDTSLQKILLFLGAPGSGKGTAIRLINILVGDRNAGSCSASELVNGPFVLDSFRGKTLEVFPDLEIDRKDARGFAGRIKSISGEDKVSINRKSKSILNETLTCRLLIASNELPNIPDPSGSLIRRYIPFRFGVKFSGREDIELSAKLVAEAPGILNWALEGLREIRQLKRFPIGPLAEGELHSAYTQGAPLAEFIEDMLDVTPDGRIEKNALYQAYVTWCAFAGNDKPMSREYFGRQLKGTVATVSETQYRVGSGARTRGWSGVRLATGVVTGKNEYAKVIVPFPAQPCLPGGGAQGC
jgi:putative DNA primase/helicase